MREGTWSVLREYWKRATLIGFLILLYNWIIRSRYHRVRFTPEETVFLKDVLDHWIEGYQDAAQPGITHVEVESLMADFDTVLKIRGKVYPWHHQTMSH